MIKLLWAECKIKKKIKLFINDDVIILPSYFDNIRCFDKFLNKNDKYHLLLIYYTTTNYKIPFISKLYEKSNFMDDINELNFSIFSNDLLYLIKNYNIQLLDLVSNNNIQIPQYFNNLPKIRCSYGIESFYNLHLDEDNIEIMSIFFKESISKLLEKKIKRYNQTWPVFRNNGDINYFLGWLKANYNYYVDYNFQNYLKKHNKKIYNKNLELLWYKYGNRYIVYLVQNMEYSKIPTIYEYLNYEKYVFDIFKISDKKIIKFKYENILKINIEEIENKKLIKKNNCVKFINDIDNRINYIGGGAWLILSTKIKNMVGINLIDFDYECDFNIYNKKYNVNDLFYFNIFGIKKEKYFNSKIIWCYLQFKNLDINVLKSFFNYLNIYDIKIDNLNNLLNFLKTNCIIKIFKCEDEDEDEDEDENKNIYAKYYIFNYSYDYFCKIINKYLDINIEYYLNAYNSNITILGISKLFSYYYNEINKLEKNLIKLPNNIEDDKCYDYYKNIAIFNIDIRYLYKNIFIKEINMVDLTIGSYVGLYYPDSSYHQRAFYESYSNMKYLKDIEYLTFNTHVGLIIAIKNNVFIIAHYINKKFYYDPINKLSNNCVIVWIKKYVR